MRASVEALSARHQAEGAPSDAGATALGAAEAAAASALALADKAPYGDDASAVTPELAGALEEALAAAEHAAVAAAAAMGRRPDHAMVRQRLGELAAKHADTSAKLSAALERLSLLTATLGSDHATAVAAADAAAAAQAAGATATEKAAACKLAVSEDELACEHFRGRALLPAVADAHAAYDARTAEFVAAVAVVDRANAAEHARAGAESLHALDKRLEAAKLGYDHLDLRVLPAAVAATYAQRSAPPEASDTPALLDLQLPGAQRAVAAVQDAGMKLVNADAVRPMVDAASGPESPTLQHFATVISSAEAAVQAAGAALTEARAEYDAAVELRIRGNKAQRWRDAAAQCAAMQASGDALAARNASDGAPPDAGSAGLREAVVAAAAAVLLFEKVPKGHAESVPVETSEELEAAVARANRLLAAASAAIGRRPERVSVRTRLDDLHAKCAAADARLAATHARIAAAQASLPADAAAVIAAHAAVGEATHYATTAAAAIDAARAATAADAVSDTTVGRDALPGVAQAVANYEAAAAAVLAAATEVDLAAEAEHARTGSVALQQQDARLEAVKRRYDALDLRVLPAGVTFAYLQRTPQAANGQEQQGEGEKPPLVKLDAALLPTQRAIAAVQDAGMRLVNAGAVRPMVDASSGADAPSLRHFTSAVDAADSAVLQADIVLQTAAYDYLKEQAAKERAARQERWSAAVDAAGAVQATIDALTTRNAAEGSPSDAGSTALREATAAAAEASAAVSRFTLGAAYDAVAAFDDIIALEQMATRAKEAAATATTAMARRPDHAAVRQALAELHDKHSDSGARLATVRERLEAIRSALPASSPAIHATLAALDHAERCAAAQAAQVVAGRAALDRDAQTCDSTDARDMLPHAATIQADLDAAVSRAAEALESAVQSRDSEARRAGSAALSALDARLGAVKAAYDALDLRLLPAGTTAAFPQQPHDNSPAPLVLYRRRISSAATAAAAAPSSQLDPLLPGTQRAVAAVQSAGMQLLHADAVRVSGRRWRLRATALVHPRPAPLRSPSWMRRRQTRRRSRTTRRWWMRPRWPCTPSTALWPQPSSTAPSPPQPRSARRERSDGATRRCASPRRSS